MISLQRIIRISHDESLENAIQIRSEFVTQDVVWQSLPLYLSHFSRKRFMLQTCMNAKNMDDTERIQNFSHAIAKLLHILYINIFLLTYNDASI